LQEGRCTRKGSNGSNPVRKLCTDGDRDKSGSKGEQKIQPETPVAGDKGGGLREHHEKRPRMRRMIDLKSRLCMRTCEVRLFVF